MTETKTGEEVREQARDPSWLNRDPAIVRGAVISLVGAVATVLVVAGVLDTEQKRVLEDNAGIIALAVLTVVPIVQAAWTRASVYSPRTAAKIAVANAALPSGAQPSLVTPP